MKQRLRYYRRILAAYLIPGKSHLTFWHGEPEVNKHLRVRELCEYYMPFIAKADYPGDYDQAGIPILDYRGAIGQQYNPTAIAQYGLGNYNLFRRTGDQERRCKFLAATDWMVANLELNSAGMWVWNHHFDFEYRTPLEAPWYSGLAQGQGISLLVRAYRETQDISYLDAAQRAFGSFQKGLDQGGVMYVDDDDHTWFEEYIVSPPTHILNGFIWAAWGVYDYFLATNEPAAEELFDRAVRTLMANLHHYDVGFWSLYEQSGTQLKMIASHFYHKLHIVQLEVLYQLTDKDVFREYAIRWEGYRRSRLRRWTAFFYKVVFKLVYY